MINSQKTQINTKGANASALRISISGPSQPLIERLVIPSFVKAVSFRDRKTGRHHTFWRVYQKDSSFRPEFNHEGDLMDYLEEHCGLTFVVCPESVKKGFKPGFRLFLQ